MLESRLAETTEQLDRLVAELSKAKNEKKAVQDTGNNELQAMTERYEKTAAELVGLKAYEKDLRESQRANGEIMGMVAEDVAAVSIRLAEAREGRDKAVAESETLTNDLNHTQEENDVLVLKVEFHEEEIANLKDMLESASEGSSSITAEYEALLAEQRHKLETNVDVGTQFRTHVETVGTQTVVWDKVQSKRVGPFEGDPCLPLPRFVSHG